MAVSIHFLSTSSRVSLQNVPHSPSSRNCVLASRTSTDFPLRTVLWKQFFKKMPSRFRIPASAYVPSAIRYSRRDFMILGLGFSSLVVSNGSSSLRLHLAFVIFAAVAPPIIFKGKSLTVESRKPERYSSAALLSADECQRIVSERVDFINNVIISVSIGPPNSLFLKSNDKRTWRAQDVADSVLSDRSSMVDGEPYWYYEYLVRKSPTTLIPETNLYRHYLGTTAERDGYLYSFSTSTVSQQWDLMGPCLKRTVDSFRLLPHTENYVPPYKDPWRFW